MANVVKISNNTISNNLMNSDTALLLIFGTEWCGPCRSMEPIIDELSDEYEEIIKFAKCDADNNPKLASDFGIQHVPSFILFKDGKIVEQFSKKISKKELKKILDENL